MDNGQDRLDPSNTTIRQEDASSSGSDGQPSPSVPQESTMSFDQLVNMYLNEEVFRSLDEDQRNEVKTFFYSSRELFEDDPKIAWKLFNFFKRQFSRDTLRANLNRGEYAVCMQNAFDGLMHILLIDGLTMETNIPLRKAVFQSCHNYFITFYSQMLGGKAAKHEVDLAQAKQPVSITQPLR